MISSYLKVYDAQIGGSKSNSSSIRIKSENLLSQIWYSFIHLKGSFPVFCLAVQVSHSELEGEGVAEVVEVEVVGVQAVARVDVVVRVRGGNLRNGDAPM